jgi:hypothetical protein
LQQRLRQLEVREDDQALAAALRSDGFEAVPRGHSDNLSAAESTWEKFHSCSKKWAEYRILMTDSLPCTSLSKKKKQLQDEDYEHMILEMCSFCENKPSLDAVYNHLLYSLIKGMELNYRSVSYSLVFLPLTPYPSQISLLTSANSRWGCCKRF